MTTPVWAPGTVYLPGAIVQPRTAQPTPITAIDNPGAEAGSLSHWTPGGSGTWSVSNVAPLSGSKRFNWSGTGSNALLENDTQIPVEVGQVLNVTAEINPFEGLAAGGRVTIAFFDISDFVISEVESPLSGKVGDGWFTRTASAIAPVGAVYALVRLKAVGVGAEVGFDDVTVSYPGGTVMAGLVFKAIQASSGTSDSTEPTWPTTLGGTVVDNDITWEAVNTSRVIWEASPIMKSGGSEPTWPTTPNERITDNTISWEALSRRVEDPNCPNTTVAVALASKIFSGDSDITRYCATARPLDWTSSDDAGFLPTGLQQSNANSVAVLAPYRSNLGFFNASCFQNWQVDPDPAAMAQLDQIDGIGSTEFGAAQPVANDLFYLSQRGVRSVSISGGTKNESSGDIGEPIDALVLEAYDWALANDGRILSTYLPGAGQYWLAFPGYPDDVGEDGETYTTVFVLTLGGGKGKWSRYVYPFTISGFAQLGNDLYIRHGDFVNKVVKGTYTDHTGVSAVAFAGEVRWAYLDNGQPGGDKHLLGLDLVATGTPSVSIGYDQTDDTAFTSPYQVPADTLPGGFIPIEVTAPTFALKVTFAGGSAWSLSQASLYVKDNTDGG